MTCALQRLSISFAILLTLSPVNPSQTAAQTSRLTYPPARRVEQVDTHCQRLHHLRKLRTAGRLSG